MNGLNIGVDTDSGAIHLFDDVSYALLDFVSEPMASSAPEAAYGIGIDKDAVDTAWNELYELYCAGELLCPPDRRLETLRSTPAPVKSMCLHVAHDCNLRCRYCFADEGCFGGKRGWLSEETAKAAIDFLIEQSVTVQ